MDNQEPTTPEKKEEKKRSYKIPSGKYTGEEKIALIHALLSMGMSKAAIAEKLHMGRSTVHFLSLKEANNPEVIDQVKKRLSGKWWISANNALEAMTAEKLEVASAAQLAMIAGISTDKARLMDGEPTHNVLLMTKDDLLLEQEIQERERELETMKATAIPVQNLSDQMPTSETDNQPLS